MPETTPQPSGALNLLRPLLLLSYSAYYILPTHLALLSTLNFDPLFSPSAFKDAWFARFWAFFGPLSREFAAPSVMPLLQNSARGVCLDIGPGSGQWLYLFARANNSEITKIYGVEPNVGMHAELRANAVKAGFGEAQFWGPRGGLGRGSVDTIITVQCLCSIPTPERIIKELYPLLKPGGKWLVYEHIRTKYQGEFVAHWQSALRLNELLGGVYANGGCRSHQHGLAALLQRLRYHATYR